MKKSTILAFIGVIIAFLIVGTLGNKKSVYEKQINFKTPKEAIVNFIGYANVTETFKEENGLFDRPSRKFLESISKRYRLFMGEDRWSSINYSIPIYFNYEIQEISKDRTNTIIENYENSLINIPNYVKPKDIKFFYLSGYGIQGRYGNTTPKADGTFEDTFGNEEEMPLSLYLVVIDEGEGYVVDYYTGM